MRQQERWQVDSSAPEAYERHLVPALFSPLAEDLLTRAALQRGERILDIACGTGAVARAAAERVGPSGRVVGVDLNQPMLDVAARQMLPSGLDVEWRQGDVIQLPCDDDVFDVVCCQQGFQFFPEKAAALQEMRRTLAPGGRLALSVWRSISHNPYMQVFGDALEKHIGPDAGNGYRAACNLGDAEAFRNFLVDAGFDDVRISIVVVTMRHPSLATFIPGQLAATPWAGAIAALDDASRSALYDEIITALRPYTDDYGLAAPTQSHVILGWKK